MGNSNQKQQKNIAVYLNKLDIDQYRFVSSKSPSCTDQNKQIATIKMSEFQRMQSWQVQLQGIVPFEKMDNTLISQAYFRKKEHIDAYLGMIYSLKQMCEISIYDDIEIKEQNSVFGVIIKQQLTNNFYGPLQRKQIIQNIDKCIDLLIFISKLISNTENLYIPPEQIVCCKNQFYLKGFYYKQYSKRKLLLNYIAWLHEQFQQFTDNIQTDHVVSFSDSNMYLKQIYATLKNGKITDQNLVFYFQKVKQKIKYIGSNFQSFHACYRAKRTKNNATHNYKQWIIAKKNSEIYFFNVGDFHLSQGKIIRKKRKIGVDTTHIIYNPDEFEVKFVLQGTKNMVRTSQFQMEDCFTISDIEIKHKFPFKIKNPMMFERGGQIYMYDQAIYRYSTNQNKLYQQSKKISDCLCLVPCDQMNYFVVRHSIDIFRHGIRVYMEDRHQVLYPSGNPAIIPELDGIKIDIKQVQFCIEVYKGIYLMLAHKNLWILDLNFMCFFSYAPIQRIKQYCKSRSNTKQTSQYAFEVINQPFPVTWLSHQSGLNVSIKQDALHLIGMVMGKLFYLQYQFIFEAGILRLKKFSPLLNHQSQFDPIKEVHDEDDNSQFTFNIHGQNLQFYKNNKWIYRGPSFIEIKKLKSVWSKHQTQICLQTEKVLMSLKQVLQQNRQMGKKWDIYQTSMLLSRVYSIFTEINKMGISHKQFNVGNLWITQKKQLKLTGWSQPCRNWYISDYRDFLLVCFNIITISTAQKLSDKLIQKHNDELSEYPALKEKMLLSLKNKVAQKKIEQQKQLLHIKNGLNKLIYPITQDFKSGNFIISFEFNTPVVSIANVAQCKIKKFIALIQDSHHNTEQFIFKTTDSYAWNEEQCKLYIFTANYQMLEAILLLNDEKEGKVLLQQFEYLPQNIADCSFIYTQRGLFAFGGIARFSKKKIVYNRCIYRFSQQKLTWVSVAQIEQPRINPKLILSASGLKIFIFGGELDCGPQHLSVLQFDASTNTVRRLTDFGCRNPLLHIQSKNTTKIFHISQKYSTFLLWVLNSSGFSIKIFSNMVGGAELDFQGKIYQQQSMQIPPVSVSMSQGAIHFLRPYGRYTKIPLSGLQNIAVVHKILYTK